MTWIFIIKQLHTVVVPPLYSIHYSEPWPMEKRFIDNSKQNHRYNLSGSIGLQLPNDEFEQKFEDAVFIPTLWGNEHNPQTSRAIYLNGEKIRIFTEEFTEISKQSMAVYLGADGGDPSHVLRPNSISEEKSIKDIRSGVKRKVYEAALIDGCSESQAFMIANGGQLDMLSIEFPNIGWYELNEVYRKYYEIEKFQIKDDENES